MDKTDLLSLILQGNYDKIDLICELFGFYPSSAEHMKHYLNLKR